jgi:hypothetical protein
MVYGSILALRGKRINKAEVTHVKQNARQQKDAGKEGHVILQSIFSPAARQQWQR